MTMTSRSSTNSTSTFSPGTMTGLHWARTSSADAFAAWRVLNASRNVPSASAIVPIAANASHPHRSWRPPLSGFYSRALRVSVETSTGTKERNGHRAATLAIYERAPYVRGGCRPRDSLKPRRARDVNHCPAHRHQALARASRRSSAPRSRDRDRIGTGGRRIRAGARRGGQSYRPHASCRDDDSGRPQLHHSPSSRAPRDDPRRARCLT